MITGSAPRQTFCPRAVTGYERPVTGPLCDRKLTSSVRWNHSRGIVYHRVTREHRAERRFGGRSHPLDLLHPLNAWSELPRAVQISEGTEEDEVLRSWLTSGRLATPLFDETAHAAPPQAQRRRREQSTRVLMDAARLLWAAWRLWP